MCMIFEYTSSPGIGRAHVDMFCTGPCVWAEKVERAAAEVGVELTAEAKRAAALSHYKTRTAMISAILNRSTIAQARRRLPRRSATDPATGAGPSEKCSEKRYELRRQRSPLKPEH